MTDLKTSEGRGIRPKLQQALQAVAAGASQAEAARQAGMSLRGLEMALTKPHVRDVLKALTKGILQSEVPRNIAVAREIRDKSESPHARLDAAKYLNALAGVQPEERPLLSVTVDKRVGLVIDLTPPVVERHCAHATDLIDVTPQHQDEA